MNAEVHDFDGGQSAELDVQPHVLVRAFSVPAGAPWEQSRAAQLEARHGAPLPISDLLYRVRRLGRWSPAGPGRFAVFYIRAREFRGPFECLQEVDGQVVKVGFGVSEKRLRGVHRLGVVAVCLALTGVVLVTSATMALSNRRRVEERLAKAEQQAERRLRGAMDARRSYDEDRALSLAAGRAVPVADVLSELAWASSVRADGARVIAIHWDRGLLAVETKGKAQPFSVAPGQLEDLGETQPGVWFWGLRRDSTSRSRGDG